MISSITLIMGVLLSPIGLPRTPDVRVDCGSPTCMLAHSVDGRGPAFTTTASDGTLRDVERSIFIEEYEEEAFWSFSHFLSPTFIASASPTRFLPGQLPGDSNSTAVTVPLRC